MSKKTRLVKPVEKIERYEDGGKKKDTSEYVYQENRVDFDLHIREFNWTEKQKIFIEAGLAKETNYILCQGSPGTGKTLLATYIGLKLLQAKRISRILYVKNPVESSNKGIGFLGGSYEEKMSPYFGPMMDHLNELLPSSELKKLLDGKYIQIVNIGFIKGRTFNSSLIIFDEAEDADKQSLLLAMTRLGRFSKMFLTGDFEQAHVRDSGFRRVFDAFNSIESMERGVYCLEFGQSDIMRNKILTFIVERFKTIV